MKTELAICLVVAAGLHAGLVLVGPSAPNYAVANPAIEVGLEDGVTDANATDAEAVPAPLEATAPLAPAPPVNPEPAPETKIVEVPPEPELEKHEVAVKPAPTRPPATANRPTVAPGVTASRSAPVRERSGGGGSSGSISTVRYRQRAALSYPMSALRVRAEGAVLLVVSIDRSGRPTDVTVRQSSGRSDLDTAAIACARQSTYEPYRVNGIPQPCRVEAPFRFDAGSRRQ